MKKFILLLILATTVLFSCQEKKESKLIIKGAISDYPTSMLYIYEVFNEHYDFIKVLDSMNVTNNNFTYSNDTLTSNLYFITTSGNDYLEKTLQEGTYLFLQKGENNIKFFKNDLGKMQAENKNIAMQQQLSDFYKTKYEVSNRKLLDSLEQVFYAARDKKDEEEMMRLKIELAPYYEEAHNKMQQWIDNQITENQNSTFGLYLFYTYRFQNLNFSTLDELTSIRKRLENADEDAKHSTFYKKIEDRLTILENCAIGHEAPEIVGLDTLDNEVKLSDFRGKYVLVDFWSSTCTWCRLETPNFQKIYDEYKDKNLVILGVSSDYNKEDWVNAIHEDKSYWNQIMMRKADMQKIMNSYAIVGIPEILLIDPQGIILAKGLRDTDIYDAVVKHVK